MILRFGLWFLISASVLAGLAGCAGMHASPIAPSPEPEASVPVPKDLFKKLDPSVFEVVVPKHEDDFVKYEHELPFDKLPYQVRNDKYVGLGTAFAVGGNRFVSAAHVFSIPLQKVWTNFYLRDRDQHVYKVTQVDRLSTYRDLIEFEVEGAPAGIPALTLAPSAEVGDTVFAVGNALGEGISYRGGQISSFSPEEINRKWEFIRFSAPVSPGNSGGPLLNAQGAVVGVVVRRNSSENLNYAVPIAELNKLSETSAEFRQWHLTRKRASESFSSDWDFSVPLPAPLSKLSEESERSFRELADKLTEKMHVLDDERFFPAHPTFREYLRHQVHKPGLGFVTPGANGQNWTVDYPKLQDIKIATDEYAHVLRYQANAFVLLDKPKEMKIADFLANPKLIMERISLAMSFSRPMAGEKIRITSLGDPQTQSEWTDHLGRHWLSSAWDSYAMNTRFSMDCLPLPRGVACAVGVAPKSLLSAGIELERRKSADEILVSYLGRVSEWDDFLALPAGKYLPAIFKGGKIERKGDQVQIKLGTYRLDFKHSGVSDDSLISARVGYSPTENLALELQFLELSPVRPDKGVYSMGFKIEPLPSASSGVKNTWEDFTGGTGAYDGKVHVSGKWSQVHLKETADANAKPQRITYVTCAVNSNEPSATLIDDCKQFQAGVQHD